MLDKSCGPSLIELRDASVQVQGEEIDFSENSEKYSKSTIESNHSKEIIMDGDQSIS